MALATPAGLRTVGSLVRTRGRDWVVLDSDHPEMLQFRPITGSDEDAVLEEITRRLVKAIWRTATLSAR